MVRKMRGLLHASVLMAVPCIAAADGMRPLSELLDDVAAPYSAARCGGFYQALMEWTGIERMGDEAWQAYDAARFNLIMLSALTLQSTNGGTLEHNAELTSRDVRNIANLYLARMEANYASVGQAFAEDDLIKGDMVLCQSFAEQLN